MSIVTTKELLTNAKARHYAVPAFNTNTWSIPKRSSKPRPKWARP